MCALRIVGLVPMRHESERVPGKNYRSFAGKPLYHHVISALLSCPFIDKVVIDTDSPVIMSDAAQHYPEVSVIERPEHLRGGTVSMNDVLLHDIEKIEADLYIQTHATNPLMSTETISAAVRCYLDNRSAYDSLFSVTKVRARLWDRNGKAINHDPFVLLRTQDLPPVYQENSCLYLFTKDTLKIRSNRIGERPFMWEMDQLDAWDIDEEVDFQIAEFLFEKYALGRNRSK
jgi:CMP-N-acetylneuraminic acid synthetase